MRRADAYFILLGAACVLPRRPFRLGRPHAGAPAPGRRNRPAGRHRPRRRPAPHGPAAGTPTGATRAHPASPPKSSGDLPAGVTAGAIQWPVPEKLPDEDFTTYIYKNEVVLLVPLKLAPDLPPGPLDLKAKVSWLECDVQCVPGKADVAATLNVGTETKPSKDAALIQTWQAKLPEERRQPVAPAPGGNRPPPPTPVR